MFSTRAKVSKVLNNYVNVKHEYGRTDCNLMVAELIDSFYGTSYKQKLQGQYTNPIEGTKKGKSLIGFNSVLEVCKEHLDESTEIKDGSVLLIERKLKNVSYYISTIVVNNRAIVEYDGKYQMVPVQDFKQDYIFNLRS